MISRLLVAVLLFAANAMTTPNSTAAEPMKITTAVREMSLQATSKNHHNEPKPQTRTSISSTIASASASTSTISTLTADKGSGVKSYEAIDQTHNPLDHHQMVAAATNIAHAISNSEKNATTTHNETNFIKTQTNPKKVYTNQFVIEVKGGEQEARRLAEKHGFIYLNHILGDYYHLEHNRLAKRSLNMMDMDDLDRTIEEEPHVLKFERQVLKKRVKRDFIDLGSPPLVGGGSGTGSGSPAGRAQQPGSNGGRTWPPTQQFLRPAGRPAQFLRPANQAPGGGLIGASGAASPQQQHYGPASAAGATPQHLGSPAADGGGRRFGQAHSHAPSGAHHQVAASSRLMSVAAQQQQQQHQQHLFDQLEMHSSGPPPLFLHANVSGAQSAGGFNKHRPPPPPIQLSAASDRHSNAGAANQTAQFHYANETVRQPAPFNDPSWPLMWYLDGGARNGFDLNVQAAWKMGFTGKGIVITILDDGLEKDHPDLRANYDPLASFDINGDDADPMPRYDSSDSNRHGTRCAGEVAAVPNNNICSIGIAFNSKVGGVRMLDGEVTDAVEARSLSLNNQHIHIYSASWGPDDNGKTVDGPGELATRAFINGVTNGRRGLGSIFIFASGNGGREHDNCNCDGYTNSIWTLSISSASENGFVPWYIEACSSTLATTYSSGAFDERQIVTTDIRHSCTNNHTGTSASAPIAAGICALVLEANPELTWRDMQHIVVRTAKPANLLAKDWRTNAMGRNVSHAFGYGLMDAAAMIEVAQRWKTVPPQFTCEVTSRTLNRDHIIPSKDKIQIPLVAECGNVRFLEHVQSKVTLAAARRGDLHIYLTSPHGTRSTLLAQRPMDVTDQGFRNWPFMTVHNWGESPNGVWTLEVHNEGKPQNQAVLKGWTLILYGTNDDPNRHLNANGYSPRQPPVTQLPPTTTTSTSTSTTTTTTTTVPPTPPRQSPVLPNRHQLEHSISNQPPPPLPNYGDGPSGGNFEVGLANTRRPSGHGGSSWSAPASSSPTPPPPPPPPPPPLPVNDDKNEPVRFGSSAASVQQTSTASPAATTSPAPATTFAGGQVQLQAKTDGGNTRPTSVVKAGASSKVDFEIVMAPAGASNSANATISPTGDDLQPQITKDIVETIDGNKIELQHPLGGNNGGGGEQSSSDNRASNSPTTRRPQFGEFDANQLDLKLTKDYRSSGGGRQQDVMAASANDFGETAVGAKTLDIAEAGPGNKNLVASESPTGPGASSQNGASSRLASALSMDSNRTNVFLMLALVIANSYLQSAFIGRVAHHRPSAGLQAA